MLADGSGSNETFLRADETCSAISNLPPLSSTMAKQRGTMTIDMAAPNEHISSSSRLGLDQHDAEIESYTSSETSSWRKMNIRGSTSVQPSSGKVSTFFTSWSPRAVSLFMFVIFSAAIIPVIQVFVQAQKQEIKDKAIDMAVDTGEWFSDQLDRAILPLFSMAQFSTNLEIFRSLPEKIGVSHAPGSLPFIDGTYLRNVTGVCDDPELVSRFTSIASGAKKHAKMDGLLVNIQLAPQGVICLLHPMNNTEDFEDGKFLDSSGAWGLDLFDSPSMNYIARESIKNEEISVAGPIKLTQCPTCDPFFIARLPIVYDGHQIEVDGVNYNRWGFTTALIDWKRLVEESGIYDSFREANLEFQLTRTDRNLNSETGDYVEEVVILAETEGYLKSRSLMKAVSTTLETTNNEWEISVLYSVADVVMWNVTMVGIGGFVSLCMAFLIYMILRQRHIHVDMLSASREKEAKIDTERNITAYFAHELRNPLSAMDNAMAILLDNSLPPGTQETVDAMQRCSDFMSGIMNNLLDVRKLEEGKLEIRENPVSLTALVDDTHKMLAPLVKSEVDFLAQIDVLPERDWVLGDFARLQQAFVNITTNAIKYTHKGSITIKTSWEGEMVKLECIDTGPGIPKSEQARLFERFVQRGGAPGTGLGLNISKQLVEVMGGTICFESDPKVKPGTTCIISLPLTPCEQPEKEAKTGGSKPIEEEITVLIIDDISMNRTMLSRRIQKFIAPNAKITSVETGEIAVEICEDQSFDVMICDQYMEEAGGAMLGTDFIIAARRKRMDSFIIGCSGNDLDASFFDAGADRVWGKPLPKNEEIIDHFREGLQGRYPQIYC